MNGNVASGWVAKELRGLRGEQGNVWLTHDLISGRRLTAVCVLFFNYYYYYLLVFMSMFDFENDFDVQWVNELYDLYCMRKNWGHDTHYGLYLLICWFYYLKIVIFFWWVPFFNDLTLLIAPLILMVHWLIAYFFFEWTVFLTMTLLTINNFQFLWSSELHISFCKSVEMLKIG